MRFENILRDLYEEFPGFAKSKVLQDGYDSDITYSAFQGFAEYVIDGLLKNPEANKNELKKVISFMEKMTSSEDREVIYLYNDLIDLLLAKPSSAAFIKDGLKEKANFLRFEPKA